MASASTTTTDSLSFFEENGYFCDRDPAIGDLVTMLERRGLAESPNSLPIVQPMLVGTTSVRPILEPFFKGAFIRLILSLGEDAGHRYIFSQNAGQKDHLIVHLWRPGSCVVLFRGSHIGPLRAVPAANGLLEVPLAGLRKKGCTPITVEMAEGGITITDKRFAIEIVKGSTITYDVEIRDTMKPLVGISDPK